MDYDDFISSLKDTNPPTNISDYLLAMWHALNNNWDDAHKIIQSINDDIASWIHAYLHRLEGDISNANYWYERAGKNPTNIPLDGEAEKIILSIIDNG